MAIKPLPITDNTSGLEMDIYGSVETTDGGWWAGLQSSELRQVYKNIHALGTLSTAHFMIELTPYDPNGPLSKVPLLHHLPVQKEHAFWAMLPWLATETSLSVLNATTDSVQVGHFQQNIMTGTESGEIAISFLETKQAHILKSAQIIKKIMFHADGTQGLPAEYMMWLRVVLFDRSNRTRTPFGQTYLVALQAASVDLAASSVAPMIVPLTFVKMYPMLPKVL